MKDSCPTEPSPYGPALVRIREIRDTRCQTLIQYPRYGLNLRKRIAAARASLKLPFLQAGENDKSNVREFTRLYAWAYFCCFAALTALVLSRLDHLNFFPVQSPYQYQLPVTLKVLPDSIAYDYASLTIASSHGEGWIPIELNPASGLNFMRLHATKGYCEFKNSLDPRQKVTVIVRQKGNQITCDVYESSSRMPQ